MECVVYYCQRRQVLYARLGIPVLLGHSKVHHMDCIRPFGTRTTDQKVVGFDISVDEVLFMDGLHTRQLWSAGTRLDIPFAGLSCSMFLR